MALTYEVEPTVVGCPSVLEFQSIVAKELGYDACRADASLDVGVRIRATPSGIEGTIGWNSDKGRTIDERRFSAQQAHCRQMAASMGFALAVQLQLMATERGSESGTSAVTGEPINDGSVPGTRSASHRVNSQDIELRLTSLSFRVRSVQKAEDVGWSSSLGAGLSIGTGLAPTPVGQGRVFASVKRNWLGLEIGAEATARSTKREDYGGGFQQELRLGAFAACYWRESIAACGLAKLGQIQVQGSGIDVPASPRGFMAQTGPRLAYELALGRHLVVLLRGEVLWSLTPWAIDLNYLTVWKMPPIAAIVGFDVATRFP
jgi:hypothetical protein